MELPPRTAGDQRLAAGELTDIRARLRRIAPKHDLATVVACSFDHRTRILPFVFADVRMVPAGVRAVAAALLDSGFQKTRIVLQHWNRNFDPARMQLDGRIPDMFLLSAMRLHYEPFVQLLRGVCRIPPDRRPLVIVGGPQTIYEPWTVFPQTSANPADPWTADLAVTGEEYVLLATLECLLHERADGEPLRKTFLRTRDAGGLDDIPGLVYARGGKPDGPPEELIDTGIQRLVFDLNEQPMPAPAYRVLEAPSNHPTLASQPLPIERVRRYTPIASLVMTLGCKFACPYCPIPAYNQRMYRVKSGQRIAEEIVSLRKEFGIHFYFGADDNFFNDPAKTLDICEALVQTEIDGKPLRKHARIGTEVTVHDTLKTAEAGRLELVRRAGFRALWIGVEDMTGLLVKKGQTPDKTARAFTLLRKHGIAPMPMMMHHDEQKLLTPGRPVGLLNQVHLLQRAGASSLQVLMITPSPGSKLFEQTYTSGMVFDRAGGRTLRPYMMEGVHVCASLHPQPWRKQLNILLAYAWFYNPLRLIRALRPGNRLGGIDAGMQALGMWGLLKTLRRVSGWTLRLLAGPIRRRRTPPRNELPMRAPDGAKAAHALDGTPSRK
ncbi:MAG: radical SAM protein [Phycisphaerae bacterium]|nr:radical SAM protein [Phycisphaerae bacterium]